MQPIEAPKQPLMRVVLFQRHFDESLFVALHERVQYRFRVPRNFRQFANPFRINPLMFDSRHRATIAPAPRGPAGPTVYTPSNQSRLPRGCPDRARITVESAPAEEHLDEGNDVPIIEERVSVEVGRRIAREERRKKLNSDLLTAIGLNLKDKKEGGKRES